MFILWLYLIFWNSGWQEALRHHLEVALRNHLSFSILKSPPANTHPATLRISSYKGSPQEELSFFSLKIKKKQV